MTRLSFTVNRVIDVLANHHWRSHRHISISQVARNICTAHAHRHAAVFLFSPTAHHRNDALDVLPYLMPPPPRERVVDFQEDACRG